MRVPGGAPSCRARGVSGTRNHTKYSTGRKWQTTGAWLLETSYTSLFLSGASLGVTGIYPTLDWLKTNTNFNDKR